MFELNCPKERSGAICGKTLPQHGFAAIAGILIGIAPLAFAQSQEVSAQAISARVVSVNIAGTLNRNHVGQLRAAIEKMRGDPFPTGLIIILDSAGGDGRAAMAMGRLARAKGAHIFVKGTCRSACALLLAGGVYRDARAFSIGIHRGRITRSVPGVGQVDVNPATDPRVGEVLELVESETRAYLLEMGMPRLFEVMQKVSAAQMRLLPTDEALELGLLGFDADYLARQAAVLMPRYGISREQLLDRSARIRERCEPELAESSKFAGCYRSAMMKE